MDNSEMYKAGKKLVYIIATLFLILTVITFFMDLDVLVLVVRLVVVLALYKGISWFRYIYALLAAIGSITLLYMLLFMDYVLFMQESGVYVIFTMIYLIAFLLFYLGSSIIMFSNKKIGMFFKRSRKDVQPKA